MFKKRQIGFILGIIVGLLIYNSSFSGLSSEGQKCLAVSLTGVVWWAAGVAQPGYVALLMLVSYVLTKAAPPDVVFSIWASPLMYLVISGYLLASAVDNSGLGKRIAYNFMLKFVSSFNSVVISAYALGLILSLFIPHPFPRSFLIMSVMAIIIKASDMPREDAAIIGLSVFAASTINSMVFLTGDSLLNSATAGNAGIALDWIGWFKLMGVPGLIGHVLMCALQLRLFKPTKTFSFDREAINTQLKALGPLSSKEIRTLIFVVIAIGFWATDFIHHIAPGWICVVTVGILAMPLLGDVLTPKDWGSANMGMLMFLTAAQAIGTVGKFTGMNAWIATVVLPSYVPTNPFVFAAIVTVISMCIHMVMGSLLAVVGIAAPAIIAYAANSGAGWNPLFPTLLVYAAVCIHWILPMHSMNILVGLGESGGHYQDKEVIRFGIAQTAVVFIMTVGILVPWWKIVGLI
jgi:di/tricarboxylate transporter